MVHILVVDDNLLSLRFFADAISANDMQCATAADGAAAVKLASTRIFDLMLIDARMPILDGVQTLRSIRGDDGPSRHSIAVATTAGDLSSHPELLHAGFAEVIGKPIDLPNLRRVLQRHLGSKLNSSSSEVQPLLGEMSDDRGLGFDASILQALRGLLSGELEALPTEMAIFARTEDLDALRDRLHRLDASAGFCATPALTQASKILRTKIDTDQAWPHTEIAVLLDCSEKTRAALI